MTLNNQPGSGSEMITINRPVRQSFDINDSSYVTVKSSKFRLDNLKAKPRSLIKYLLLLLLIILVIAVIVPTVLLTQSTAPSSVITAVTSAISTLSSTTTSTSTPIMRCPIGFKFIDFDEFNNSRIPLPRGYNGYQWSNVYVLTPTDHPGSGYNAALSSGQYVAYNSLGRPMSIIDTNITSADGFSVWSFLAAAAWNNGLILTITGVRSRAIVYTASFELRTTESTHILLKWNNIQNITFVASGGVAADGIRDGSHFAIDNLCITARI